VKPPRTGMATRLVQAGRRTEWTGPIVSVPPMRASTVIFRSLADYERACRDFHTGPVYATHGLPTQWGLEEALTALEPGAAGTRLFPSGLAAVAAAILSVAGAGDHVLLPDNCYGPTRRLAKTLFQRMGIEATFYDPMGGAGVAAAFRDNTRALHIEAPGSGTFEVPDTRALVAAAKARGAWVTADNTWGTPLRFPALTLGADLSAMALTKYVGGHSDVLGGSVTAAPSAWERLRDTATDLGQCLSPDDAWLCTRGLRTMHLRLAAHEAAALDVARWLSAHPLIARVLHPALPSCPGHEHWQRDFTGSTSLFSFVLKRPGRPRLAAMLEGMRVFQIGFSFGGFESLIIPLDPAKGRTVTRWDGPGPTIRLHVGLEDVADLIADLEAGLARYEAAV